MIPDFQDSHGNAAEDRMTKAMEHKMEIPQIKHDP